VHDHPVAATLAAAVARRDPARLAALLTGTVRLRALLPSAAIVAQGRADAAGAFHGWFADFDTVEVLESAGEAVADRLLIHYRLGLRRAATRWVCTQTAVCKIVDGHLAVIDLLCSGFREAPHDEHVPDDPDPHPRARLVG
jgi:DNA-binding GntR family transcriptional regulator